MKLVTKLVPAVIAAALMSNAAYAADGTINFAGELIDQTCTIEIDGKVAPVAATVTLPTVSTGLLTTSGNTAGRTNFEIELSNCTAGGKARAFFESGATVDPISGQLYVTGGATNVRLQLLDNSAGAGGAVIKAGDTNQLGSTTAVNIMGGIAVLPYAVEYVATGAATAGIVNSSVTYSIDYE